jgi:hypothetical protein
MAYRKFPRYGRVYRKPKSGFAKVTQGLSLLTQIIRLLKSIFR